MLVTAATKASKYINVQDKTFFLILFELNLGIYVKKEK